MGLGSSQSAQKTNPPLPSPALSEPADPPTAGSGQSSTAKQQVAAAQAEAPKPKLKPEPKVETKPAPAASTTTAKLPPANISQTWRIQVVAAGSEAAARKVWAARAAALPNLLGDKSLQIMKFVKGEKTYYRARGGPFGDRKAAVAACDALKAKKLGCIIVKPGS